VAQSFSPVEFGISVAIHLAFGIAAAVLSNCEGGEPTTPPAEKVEVIMVEMSGPAAGQARMPQKAERAPRPPAGDPDPTPPPPEPAPKVQSDMVLKTPEAPKKPGVKEKDPKADDARREELMKELRRKQLMDELRDAPLGKEDRAAATSGGTAGAKGATAGGTGGGSSTSTGVNDPELARWTEAARLKVQPNWTPIRAYCKAGRVARVAVKVDAGGNKTGKATIQQSSGDPGFDGAAVRAVESTPRLPAPPARFSNGLTGVVEFRAEECP
jgi:protein TonB